MDSLVLANLRPELFRQLLNGPSTYRVEHLQAKACPNMGDHGGHKPNCPVCRGLGYIWDRMDAAERTITQTLYRGSLEGEKLLQAPEQVMSLVTEGGVSIPESSYKLVEGSILWLEGEDPLPELYEEYTIEFKVTAVRALVQDVRTQRALKDFGFIEFGDVQVSVDRYCEDGVTLNPLWEASANDRIRLLDTWRRHKEVITVGQTLQIPSRLMFQRAREVQVFQAHGEDLLPLVPEEDYHLEGDLITWLNPNVRAAAVEYLISPEYYLFDQLPQTRHIDGLDLPRRFIARQWEKFRSMKGVVK